MIVTQIIIRRIRTIIMIIIVQTIIIIIIIIEWHYLSNAARLIHPRLFYALCDASRIT